MKNKRYLALTAVALATLSLPLAPALAEDATQPPPADDVKQEGKEAKEAKFEKRGREMFEKTDADKDGFLSKAEMEASQKARMEEMFTKTDSDKDGKLSPEELKKGREAMRERFKSKYKDHDGRREHDRPDHEDDRKHADKPEGKPAE